MLCKSCKRAFRSVHIPENEDRICYKCGHNNGKAIDDKNLVIHLNERDKPLKKYKGSLVPCQGDFNSARSQSECPHCGEKSKGGFYSPVTDRDCFIGYMEPEIHSGRDNQYMTVFRCRKCHEEFWLHDPNVKG